MADRREHPEGSTIDQRCVCGNLLARIVPEGVEVKCRRCKRVVVIPLVEATDSDRPRSPPPPRTPR
jgi:phage FluMu protein Com